MIQSGVDNTLEQKGSYFFSVRSSIVYLYRLTSFLALIPISTVAFFHLVPNTYSTNNTYYITIFCSFIQFFFVKIRIDDHDLFLQVVFSSISPDLNCPFLFCMKLLFTSISINFLFINV